MKTISYKTILKIGFAVLMIPAWSFMIWIGLLAYGMIYAEVSARNMVPSIPFNPQLVNQNRWSGSDGASEKYTYFVSQDLLTVLVVIEKQCGSFTKSTDAQGREVYSKVIEDRSLPMQIFSQMDVTDDLPNSFPLASISIYAGRGSDPTGTTIVIGIGWPI